MKDGRSNAKPGKDAINRVFTPSGQPALNLYRLYSRSSFHQGFDKYSAPCPRGKQNYRYQACGQHFIESYSVKGDMFAAAAG